MILIYILRLKESLIIVFSAKNYFFRLEINKFSDLIFTSLQKALLVINKFTVAVKINVNVNSIITEESNLGIILFYIDSGSRKLRRICIIFYLVFYLRYYVLHIVK